MCMHESEPPFIERIESRGDEPLKTFESALKWFSVPSNTIACITGKRWPDGVVHCPVCGGKDVRYLASRQVWECRDGIPSLSSA